MGLFNRLHAMRHLRFAIIAFLPGLLVLLDPGVRAVFAQTKVVHTQYIAIDDPQTEKFVAAALAEAIKLLGKPAIPVEKVHVRLSTPIDPNSKLRRNFQICQVVDAEKGEFVIYLSHKPTDANFHGQLAHEVGHLLNARLRDCYVEGLNTVFAESFLRKNGLDWSRWDRYYRKGSDTFYGATYLMMKDVAAAAGDEHVKTMLSFARGTDEQEKQMHIDIDAWIQSLPQNRSGKVKSAILRHAENVQNALAKDKATREAQSRPERLSTFVVPQ
jgi:hypothetical protein